MIFQNALETFKRILCNVHYLLFRTADIFCKLGTKPKNTLSFFFLVSWGMEKFTFFPARPVPKRSWIPSGWEDLRGLQPSVLPKVAMGLNSSRVQYLQEWGFYKLSIHSKPFYYVLLEPPVTELRTIFLCCCTMQKSLVLLLLCLCRAGKQLFGLL